MSKLPKAILVDIIPPNMMPEDSLARLNELESLLVTYGGFVIVRKTQKKQVPDYKTYKGRIRALKRLLLSVTPTPENPVCHKA